MADRSDRERRALEALIVLRLRAGCDVESESDKFPAITQSDQENLKCLNDDFIDTILAKSSEVVRPILKPAEVEQQQQQPIGGLLRADEFDGASADEVERNRQMIRAKAKEANDGSRDQTSG